MLTCAIFYIASIIPSNANDYGQLNSILGGTWFILLSSTIAFLLSAVINNFLNYFISKCFKEKNSKKSFVVATYVSTFVGQFLDNLMFSMMVFMFFAPIYWDGFSWTFIQCIMCALTGATLELIMEVIFSPIGYKIVKKWNEQNVGKKYLDLIRKDK